jgi:Ni/Fe-hydrogenase 1 B-type cytochrome subunit
MWVIVCFSMIHTYLAIREDIMSNQSLVSTMISGWRYFKDDKDMIAGQRDLKDDKE